MDYQKLKSCFLENADPKIAHGMEAYMKGQFKFLGIQSTQRRKLARPFLKKDSLPSPEMANSVVWSCWQEPWREFQYFGMELFFKYRKSWNDESLQLFEQLVVSKSWWDTVDYIASNLVGCYLQDHPEQKTTMLAWSKSGNLWLERCSILFQLKYKDQVDTLILSEVILRHSKSTEFFHRKAIGWALRQYSKYNPEWVRSFVAQNTLSGLSYREATKYL